MQTCSMFGSKAKVPPRSTQHAEKPNDQPKDALAALMEGETPDERSLRFPNEKTDSWRAGSSQSRPGARMEDYNTDYSFGSKSDASMGEYRPRQQNSALDSKHLSTCVDAEAFMSQKGGWAEWALLSFTDKRR